MFIDRERVCFQCPPCCIVLLVCKERVDQEVIFTFTSGEPQTRSGAIGLEVQSEEKLNMRLPIGTFIKALFNCCL